MAERTYAILDIETVPDRELYDPERDAPKRESRGEATEESFPPPWAHRVVVVAILWLGPDHAFRKLGSVGLGSTDEPKILRDLAGFLDKEHPSLVTFNGRRFDLPVLALRSMRHGVPAAWYFWNNNAYRQRFRAELHADLCEELSDYGSVRRSKLDAVARLVGLPGKFGIDGSQVESAVARGELEEVRNYCQADVVQTMFVWLRYLLLRDALPLETFRARAAALRDALAQQPAVAEVIEKTDWDRYLLTETASGG
ncbi:MAG: 3'-5' exonuclease [Deltaproteobacteria bacterium]|nr:3'-5' exonuclease [Deltaproteobacteria bacterium]